jgi:hypothetical protein
MAQESMVNVHGIVSAKFISRYVNNMLFTRFCVPRLPHYHQNVRWPAAVKPVMVIFGNGWPMKLYKV